MSEESDNCRKILILTRMVFGLERTGCVTGLKTDLVGDRIQFKLYLSNGVTLSGDLDDIEIEKTPDSDQ